MMTSFFRAISAGLGLLVLAIPAASAETKSIAKHGVWETFVQPDKAKPVCFAVARPAKSEGSYSRRGDVSLIVTHRPAERSLDVVSFVAGYPLKPDAEVSVEIGKTAFRLYAVDESAWARDADEKKLLAALKAGKEARQGCLGPPSPACSRPWPPSTRPAPSSASGRRRTQHWTLYLIRKRNWSSPFFNLGEQCRDPAM
jgi:hypothetical protein